MKNTKESIRSYQILANQTEDNINELEIAINILMSYIGSPSHISNLSSAIREDMETEKEKMRLMENELQSRKIALETKKKLANPMLESMEKMEQSAIKRLYGQPGAEGGCLCTGIETGASGAY